MKTDLPAYIDGRIDPAVYADLSATLNDGRYGEHDESYAEFITKTAMLSVVDGPDYVSNLHKKAPARLQMWRAEADKLAPLLERMTARQRRWEADQKIKSPYSGKHDKKGDAEDMLFRKEIHAQEFAPMNATELRRQMREAAHYHSNPESEAEAIMNVECPYTRVIEAASRLRAGRRVDLGKLHYFKN